MKQIQLYQNTLQTLLSEILQNNKEKKIIVLGVRRISAVIFCALKSIHGDVAYFLDNESEQEVEGNRVFFDRPVFSVHHLLYEDLNRIAVINSLHYIEKTEELVSVFGLKPEYNLFNLNGYQKVLRWNCLDPLLGYSREDTISGFYLHGEDKENVLRIVTLGGATTDFSYSHIKSWPQFLHEMLLLKGIENAVYNGGMNGYTSCEEREKMRRDVLALKPDIVLSLSGECDIDWVMVSSDNPFYSNYYQKKIGGILKQFSKSHQKVWFDRHMSHIETYHTITDYENWIRNQRIINALAKNQGISFYCFLQPFIFEGNYQMSDFESKWMEIFLSEGVKYLPSIKRIFDGYGAFYQGVKNNIRDKDYIVDLTDVFDGSSGVYSDGVHYDEIGNCLIAERICEILIKRENLIKNESGNL